MREFTRVQPNPGKKVVMLSFRRKERGGNGRNEIATKKEAG